MVWGLKWIGVGAGVGCVNQGRTSWSAWILWELRGGAGGGVVREMWRGGTGRNVARSGRRDLNPRPPAPKAGALPNCATSRTGCMYVAVRRKLKAAGRT